MSATRIRPHEIRQAQAFALPERSLAQRLEALQLANVIRVFRADWKKEVKLGQREILEPLHALAEAEGGETMWDSMKVFDYLVSIPGVGPTKAKKWLVEVRVSPSKHLGGLSLRQRTDIAAHVRAWGIQREQRAQAYHRELVRRVARGREAREELEARRAAA